MKVNNEVEYTVSMKDLLSSKIKNATTETNKLQTAVGGVKSSINSIGGALGISLGVAGIVSFGKSVVDSLKNYEYFSASLRTLMHGDAQTAKALETQLVSLASKTPFSLTEIQDATKQLMAYGFSAGTVTQNISMLGDVASALKIPFSDIAYLYGTLKTQGRAYTRDIMQFTSRGIPVVAELAKQYGVTDNKVKELVESGKVGFPEVEKAFKSMTSEGGMFFNMMDQQSQTVGGKLSNLGDNWEQLKVNIGKSQSGIISGTVTWANDMLGVLTTYYKRQNQMKEDLVKGKAEEVSTFKHYFSEISTVLTGYGLKSVIELEKYNNDLQYYYVDNPAKTFKEAYQQEVKLQNQLIRLKKDYLYTEDGMDSEEYLQKKALLEGAIKAVKGNKDLLSTKSKGASAANNSAISSKASMDAVKASAPKATQINISFKNLIEKQVVEVKNAGSGFVANVGDSTAQALLNALNDVNRIAAQ
jgi:hypothetical protein